MPQFVTWRGRAPRRTPKLSVPVRLSAMIGASLVLWGAILIPFLA